MAIAGCALLLAPAMGACRPRPLPAWEQVPLATFTGRGTVSDVNEAGVVAGTLVPAPGPGAAGPVPVLWEGGRPRVLSPLPGDVQQVNDAGQAIGWVQDGGARQGVIWQPDGSEARIPSNGFHLGWQVQNERGQVVGGRLVTGAGGEQVVRTVLLDGDVERTIAEAPADSVVINVATAVNERGQVLVQRMASTPLQPPYQPYSAFVWDDGVVTEVPSTPGRRALGVDMNDDGLVVGASTDFLGADSHAFTFDGQRTVDLAPLPGDTFTEVVDVNDAGLPVGTSSGPNGTHAVVWAGGTPVELAGLGGAEARPVAINERGQVVGTALEPNFVRHAVVWHDTHPVKLGPPTTAERRPVALDDAGLIVGVESIVTGAGGTRPLSWTPSPAPAATP
jgi:hypothetical protein